MEKEESQTRERKIVKKLLNMTEKDELIWEKFLTTGPIKVWNYKTRIGETIIKIDHGSGGIVLYTENPQITFTLPEPFSPLFKLWELVQEKLEKNEEKLKFLHTQVFSREILRDMELS